MHRLNVSDLAQTRQTLPRDSACPTTAFTAPSPMATPPLPHTGLGLDGGLGCREGGRIGGKAGGGGPSVGCPGEPLAPPKNKIGAQGKS